MSLPNRKAGWPGPLAKIVLGSILVFVAVWPCPAQQAPSAPLGPLGPRTGLLLKDDAVKLLIQASSGDLAYDYVANLIRWHRPQASDEYAAAAQWVADKAAEFGLEHVSIERFPSDGKIAYFGYVTPARWKARMGELWLVSPYHAKLTSYAELPLSLVEGSTTADIEAELVDVGAGTSDGDYAAGVRDKIVLTSSNTKTVFARAVGKEGAAGVISSWSIYDFDYLNRRPGDFPDQVGWMVLPEGEAGSPHRFAFAISTRRAQELRNLLSLGKPVRVRAIVDAEVTSGELGIVSGTIPGSAYPEEEIIITAHLDHYKPGANDNASGSAAILEMARALRRLIDEKAIPAPLRTIRFMWVPEYLGTCAWLAKHLRDPVKRLADLNFDMVGENVMKTNSVVSACATSDSNPTFLNAVIESILEFVNRFNDDRYPTDAELFIGSAAGTRNRAAWRMVPFVSGSDHDLYNSLKIAATTLTSWPDDYYHSSEDTLDKVDPTALHRAVVMGLATITTLAYADSPQARDLAQMALLYGRRHIAQSEFKAARLLLGATKETFNEAVRLAGNLIAHAIERERAAVCSSAVFARATGAAEDVRRTAAMLEGDEKAARKRIEDLAGKRAVELKVTRGTAMANEQEKRAARLVPVWVPGKALFPFDFVRRTLAGDASAGIPKIDAGFAEAIRRLRQIGVAELTIYGFENAPALYADGKRTVLEIRNAVEAEYTPLSLDALELYFRAYEKAGLMRIMTK